MSKKNYYNQCSEIVMCIYVPFLVISCLPLFILFNLKNKKKQMGGSPTPPTGKKMNSEKK